MKRLLLLSLLLPACLDVADGRARRDQLVGQARLDALSVNVDDGLAAVISLQPGLVELWANAPDLSLRLDGLPAGGFEIRIANVLAEAQLRGTMDDGATLPITELEAFGGARRWLVTPPLASSARFSLSTNEPPAPFRVAVFGDVQSAWPQVQDLFDLMNQDDAIRFVLATGDLTEQGSPSQLARFKTLLAGLKRPCFMTLGNHELGERDDLFHDFFGRGSSHFAYRGAQVTFLDSASATLAPQVYRWLDTWLAQAIGQPHMVLTHYPVLDPVGVRNGAFASRAEAAALLAKLARGGVGALFQGHVHSYYAYTSAGIPAYISGGGGAIPEKWDGIGRHYLTVDVDPARLDFDVAVVRVD
jgi:Icc protein